MGVQVRFLSAPLIFLPRTRGPTAASLFYTSYFLTSASAASMDRAIEKSAGFRILLAIAAVVIIVAGMRIASDLLVPLLLAAFLAVISLPPLHWLSRHRVPNWLSIVIVAASLVILVTLLGGLIASSVSQFNAKLPEYQDRVQQEADRLIAWWDQEKAPIQSWFDELVPADTQVSPEDQVSPEGDVERDAAVLPTSDLSADDPAAMPPETTGAAKSWFDASWVFSYVGRTLSSLAGVLGNAFLILITVVFILLEAATIPTKLRAMPGSSTRSLDNLDKIVTKINQYMAIKTITSIVTGVLVTIWLSIVGVDFVLLWGLFAFLLNYVPNIGSILAAVPAVLLAFVQLDLGSAAAAALGYVVINMLIGYVIEPRFMGRGLGLSTLVVFLSLVFWGWVLGPVGMLLSVPLTMTAKITLEGNDDTRWIAILLGTGSDAAESVSQLLPESVEELTDLEHPPS